ncbi:MAG: peptidoglycan-associated lipoprotein Pal [Xylophilus ampelinus]
MFKKISLALAITALVAGCSSGVKVNDTASANTGMPTGSASGAGAGGTSQSSVAPVDLSANNSTAAGPVGVARIVYFDFDSYVVKPEFQSLIDGHARFLQANSNRRISIEGHTDDVGGREYNLALGQKRAEAVRRALSLLGVRDTQMEAVSFGKEKPAVPGSSESARSENRRAEISYR